MAVERLSAVPGGVGRQALDRVYLHVKREMAERRERENDITRLFFSSLGPTDLATAQQTIQAERHARAQDRKTLARSAAPKNTTSRACR